MINQWSLTKYQQSLLTDTTKCTDASSWTEKHYQNSFGLVLAILGEYQQFLMSNKTKLLSGKYFGFAFSWKGPVGYGVKPPSTKGDNIGKGVV